MDIKTTYSNLTAGETLVCSVSYSDYPSTTHSLQVQFRAGTWSKAVTGSSETGGGFAVVLSADDTEAAE